MFGILRKNLFTYLFVPIIVMAQPTVYSLKDRVNDPFGFFLISGVLIFFGSLVPVISVEVQEEKFRGYNMLATLPLTVREIVAAKFLFLPISIVFMVALNYLLLSRLDITAQARTSVVNYLAASGAAALVTGAVAILVAYRFTAMILMVSIGIVVFILNLATFLLAGARGGDVGRLILMIRSFFEEAGLPVISAICAAAVFLSWIAMEAAVRVKSARLVS